MFEDLTIFLFGRASLVLPVKKERLLCPFYDLNNLHCLSLLDYQECPCALIEDDYPQCIMERDGENPNWKKCPYNTKETIQTLEKGKSIARRFL